MPPAPGSRESQSAAPSLGRTPRSTLTESVASQLLEFLRKMEPGARMPSERELVRILGVGRTTIREALRGLEVLGAVSIRHGQGMFVGSGGPLSVDTDDLAVALSRGLTADLVEARRTILAEVARLAAERRTEEDIESLMAVLAAHRRAIETDRAPTQIGARFDQVLAEAAHNEVFVGVLRSFSRLAVQQSAQVYEGSRDFWATDYADHEAIVEAVVNSDPRLAARRMRAHTGRVGRAYRRVAAL